MLITRMPAAVLRRRRSMMMRPAASRRCRAWLIVSRSRSPSGLLCMTVLCRARSGTTGTSAPQGRVGLSHRMAAPWPSSRAPFSRRGTSAARDPSRRSTLNLRVGPERAKLRRARLGACFFGWLRLSGGHHTEPDIRFTPALTLPLRRGFCVLGYAVGRTTPKVALPP